MICQGLSRQQANALYLEVLEANDREAIRQLCREDLFFLLTIGCKRKDIDRDWLYDRCREVEASPDGHLDLWAREHYKAICVNEVVPTPTGWKRHGDLVPGDQVFGSDGKPCTVVAKTEVFTDADCYRITFDDGYSVVVSGEHLWSVEHPSRRRVKGTTNQRHYRDTVVKPTKELFETFASVKDKYSIKQVCAEYPKAKLPVHPYVLGAWLGDGHSDDGRITCGDPELFDYITSLGYDLSDRTNALASTVYGIRPLLRKLGVLSNKHIPNLYLHSSKAQRFELLRGLMDTDGHASTRGTATFVNKNKAVAEGVFELCASLGLKPTLRTHMYDHGAVYHVSFQAYKNERPFNLERKLSRCKDGERKGRRFMANIERVESTPVSCIQVDREDGLYLIGRHFVTTHNSTIITFGKSIQDILVNPDVLIGIFSHTRSIAKGFLDQIKRELEGNTFLKAYFDDVLYQNPLSEAPKWSLNDGIIVKRKANPKESTVEAWGLVDGQPTSKHFSILLYDDVVTLESVTTPEQIRKTTAAWEMSQNLGAAGGVARYIGTRYHANDTYRTMMERGSVEKRIYAATHNGKMDGDPVFLSAEVLAKKRRDQGPYTFGTQMLQDPVADKSMGFKEEWLKYYKKLGDYSKWNLYVLVDPSSGRKKASGDYTVMEVIGLAPDENYYLIDAIRDRLNLTQRASKLFEFHEKYKPKNVGYESYGMQADIEHIKYEMEQRNYRFGITELGGSMAKEDRILKLVPIFEQGRMWMPEKLTFVNHEGRPIDYVRSFKEDEYDAFPVSTHDDMLDTRARILDPALDAKFPKPKPAPIADDFYGGRGGGSWMG